MVWKYLTALVIAIALVFFLVYGKVGNTLFQETNDLIAGKEEDMHGVARLSITAMSIAGIALFLYGTLARRKPKEEAPLKEDAPAEKIHEPSPTAPAEIKQGQD